MEINAKDVMALRKKTGAGMMDCKKALRESEGDFDGAVKYLREKGMAAAKKRADREASEGRIVFKLSDDGKNAAIVEVNSETDFVSRNEQFIAVAEAMAVEAYGKADKAGKDGLISVDEMDITPVKELAGKLGENLGVRRAGFLSTENGFIETYIHPGDMLGVALIMEGDADALATDGAKALAHDLALQIAAAAPSYVSSKEVPEDVIEKEKEIYKAQMRNEGKPENILDKIAMGKINKYFEEICLLNQMFVKEQKTKVADHIKAVAGELGGKVEPVRFIRFKVGEGNA